MILKLTKVCANACIPWSVNKNACLLTCEELIWQEFNTSCNLFQGCKVDFALGLVRNQFPFMMSPQVQVFDVLGSVLGAETKIWWSAGGDEEEEEEDLTCAQWNSLEMMNAFSLEPQTPSSAHLSPLNGQFGAFSVSGFCESARIQSTHLPSWEV